jgi:tetratricopeptide (TPR) repeat protein
MQEPVLAKWLRWLTYATALVPLVVFSQFISPFHFGKVIVFRSIVQLMTALYVLLIWRDRSYLPKRSPILWAFVVFTAVFTLTSITGVAWLQSFWGTLERMGGLFTFWHYLVFAVIATAVLRTRRDWQTLLDLVISVGVVSALYGFLQRFNLAVIIGSDSRERIFGTIGNPALFAGYQILVAYLALTLAFIRRAVIVPPKRIAQAIGFGLGAAVLIGLLSNAFAWLSGLWVVPLGYAIYGVFLWMAESERGARWFYICAATLMFLAVFMTAVRGSILGVAVASLLFALLWSTLYRSKKAKNALLIGIGALAVFFVFAMAFRSTSFVQNSPYLSRVTDFSSSTFTVQTRFWAWQAGFEGWSENAKTVTLGWGPENFNIPFSKHFNPKFFTGPGSETFFDRAHNMFVEVTVTMGVLGILAYLSMFIALFWALIRLMRTPGDNRIIGIGFTTMIVAYIIHNCFIFDTSANYITFFTMLAFVVFASTRGLGEPESSKFEIRNSKLHLAKWTGTQKAGATVLTLAVVVGVYATNIRPSLANFATTRAIVAGWQGDWANAVNNYRQSIGYDAPGRYEFRDRFAQYLLETSNATDISKVPDFQSVTLEAIADVQQNIVENPDDYLPYLYISRLYIILGKNDKKSPYNDKALEYSMAALKISPTFVRTLYEVAQAYINKGDLPAALQWFTKAKDLNPTVGGTWWYMGIVQYQIAANAKDNAGIKQAVGYLTTAVQKGYGLSESDSQKLVSAYAQEGDVADAVPVLEQMTKNYPTNSQYWGSLATAYAQMGRTQDAITAARKVYELSSGDAQTQAQAEQFIKSLGGTL